MGDQRVYGKLIAERYTSLVAANIDGLGYLVILRAVCTVDFMSAEPYEFDFSLIKQIARRIVNEVDGVSRVTYDITSKPPGKCMQAGRTFLLLTLYQVLSSWSEQATVLG